MTNTARTCNLGRIAAQRGPHAGKTSRRLHRFPQLLVWKCATRPRTMHQPEDRTGTAQQLSRVGWPSNGKCARAKRASCLCMPVTYKKRVPSDAPSRGTEERHDEMRQCFVFRNYWFVLAQTEGETPYEQAIPGFDLDTALQTLNITRTPFDEINGNVQGFAHQREIAVSPIAELPLKTTLHEMAHVVLGHTTSQKLVDLRTYGPEHPGSRG